MPSTWSKPKWEGLHTCSKSKDIKQNDSQWMHLARNQASLCNKITWISQTKFRIWFPFSIRTKMDKAQPNHDPRLRRGSQVHTTQTLFPTFVTMQIIHRLIICLPVSILWSRTKPEIYNRCYRAVRTPGKTLIAPTKTLLLRISKTRRPKKLAESFLPKLNLWIFRRMLSLVKMAGKVMFLRGHPLIRKRTPWWNSKVNFLTSKSMTNKSWNKPKIRFLSYPNKSFTGIMLSSNLTRIT